MLGNTKYTPLHRSALRRISHSALETLFNCPHKFELSRLLAVKHADSVTLTFGHSYGAGVAALFCGKSLGEAMVIASLAWKLPLSMEDKEKTFGNVLVALEVSKPYIDALLENYELVHINGKPAVELPLVIKLPGDYTYRGYLDVLLVHKETRQFLVVDCKHTGAKYILAEKYANSLQGVGYSIICDTAAAQNDYVEAYNQGYEVLYFVLTTAQLFGEEPVKLLPFYVDKLRRVLWLKQLVMFTAQIEMYIEEGMFPQTGSCVSYNKPCHYFDLCWLDNTRGVIPSQLSEALAADEERLMGALEFTYEQIVANQ